MSQMAALYVFPILSKNCTEFKALDPTKSLSKNKGSNLNIVIRFVLYRDSL